MRNRPVLWGLVEAEFVTRLLFVGLLIALLVVADSYVMILLSRQFGIYLLLALAASTGLIGAIAVLAAYRNELDSMWRSVAKGTYPQREFRRFVPLLAGAALLIIPGFVSDAIGLVLLVRPLGWAVGSVVERRFHERFVELYEYLRLAR